VTEAAALGAPDPERRRADFTAAEMAAGEDLFFAQSDNRSSQEMVYRLRVLEMRPGRLVIQTENVSTVRLLLLSLFEPGESRSHTSWSAVRRADGSITASRARVRGSEAT
jgi:hypothetical protein